MLTDSEMVAIQALLNLALAVDNAMDVSEMLENGDYRIWAPMVGDLEKACDGLDELPDDRPGRTMGMRSKAEWALRRILGIDDTQRHAFGGVIRHTP